MDRVTHAAQLRLDFPERRSGGDQRIWILAPEGGGLPTGQRHTFVDSTSASSFAGPGDVALVRTGEGRYSVLMPENLFSSRPDRLSEAIARQLKTGAEQARRISEIVEVTGIAPRAGICRGRLTQQTDDVRSRTDFEHALLSVASRNGPHGASDALRAIALSETIPEEDVHPVVHGVFSREKGDLLDFLSRRGNDGELVSAAIPAYLDAARAFRRAGLRHQASEARKSAANLHRSIDQSWLPGLPVPPRRRTATFGYGVERYCGFGIVVRTDLPLPVAHGGTHSVFRKVEEIELSDKLMLGMLAGAHQARQRAVAVVRNVDGHLMLQAGLSDEVHAYMGALSPAADYSDVIAVMLDSPTLPIEGPAFLRNPSGPVSFRLTLTEEIHDVSLRIAMAKQDDLLLRFRIEPAGRAVMTYI